ncbi:hypothetical protein GCM10009641_85860 [Mycobacterium cookii]|uniref:SdpI family protein n=3 Tax=Nocardioides furvisabuli TaxID=375542 RepID=A0ABP5J610_9ACTN
MVLALVGAWGLVTVAAAMWFVAGAGERGDLSRNGLVGIRTSATRASDRAWEAGHRATSGPARTMARVVVGIAAFAARTGIPSGFSRKATFRILVPRTHPAEQAEAGTLAPAIVCTVTSPGACGLRDLVAHGKQHVAAEQEHRGSPHESASTSCATLGDPASPCGVE